MCSFISVTKDRSRVLLPLRGLPSWSTMKLSKSLISNALFYDLWLILLILIFLKDLILILFFFYFSDKRPEQSIASARASVMIYDDLNKKWVPSGTSHGLSKVHIYHHFINNTFRVVGRKLQDHEVRTLSLNLSGVSATKSLLKTFVVLY